MFRRAFVLVLLAVAAGAGAESPSLAVRAAGPTLLESANRQTVSLALICESSENTERSFIIAPRLPDGWKAVGGYDEFSLEAGVADVRLVSFLVPAEAPAGEYSVGFELRDRDDPDIAAACSLEVVVLPVVAFELDVLEVPAFVLAGEEYESTFVLTNSGNVGMSFDLEVDCGQALPCRIVGLEHAAEVPVAARTRLEFRVVVRTQAGIRHSTRHPVRVLARLHGDGSDAGPAPASATSVVEVIPLSLGSGSLMHTIPLTFLTAAGMAFTPGFTGFLEESINASGTLDELGEHRLDLSIRKQLATGQDPLFAASDRYSVRYEQRLGEIRLGDHAYSLSPLLVMNRFGRGVGGTLVLNPLRLSAILYKDVWNPAGGQGLGGSVDFTIRSSGSWDDVLYRVSVGALWPLADHAIIGLWQHYNPLPRLSLQLDAALDIGPGGVVNPAVLALAQGEVAGVSWNVRALRAWPGFTGESADSQSLSAGARAKLLDGNLVLDAMARLSDGNLLLDPARPAERSIAFSLGAAGDVPAWDSEASLGYDLTRRLDRFPVPSFMNWEHHVQAGWTQWFLPYTASLASSLTFTIDELTGTLLSTQKHLLSLAYDPSPSARYDLSLSWSRRRTDTLMPNDCVGLSAGAVLLLGSSRLEGRLGNTWSYAATGLASVRFGLDAGFTSSFSWGHTLSIKGGASLTYEALAWTSAGSLSASYGIPVDLPVSRKKDVSVVRGTVVRQETGRPQEGIVLRLNGLASATDRSGEFTIYVPKSGRIYLTMDPRTLAPGVIPAQTMPLELTVAPDSESVLRLATVAGCTVTGMVEVHGYPSESAAFVSDGENATAAAKLQRIGGLGNLVVELSNGSERKRRVTGADGRFLFEEVRPGRWTIAIVGGQLPTWHSLEQQAIDLDLAAGERREIDFKVIQDQRRITMVDTGFTVVTESARGPGGITVTSGSGWTPSPEQPGETAVTESPETAETTEIAGEKPQPTPDETAAIAPALIEPAPAEPARPEPGERRLAPVFPSQEERVMAAQAAFNAPELSWREYLAAMLPQPIVPGEQPIPVAAEPPEAATGGTAPAAAALAPAGKPAASAPSTPTPAVPATEPPATTSPAAPAATPTPAPSTPGVTITIPLPMPTPQPPVTVPVPSPTPQPFWP